MPLRNYLTLEQWAQTDAQYNLQNKKKTKTLVRNVKKNSYEKIFDKQNDSNGKSFYGYLNQTCHPNTKRKLEITNTIDTETLNNFFVNIGPSLSKKIEKPYNGNMINRVVDSFVLKPIRTNEMKFEIKQPVGKKGSDYMGLTNHLLKTINPVISGYLTDIFNKVIDESHHPKSLNVSKVVPILKNGDPNKPNNYRPNSLVPLFGKIIKKIIKRRLMSILLKNKILSRKQFGFLSKRSTVDALTEMLENIQKLREKNVLTHCTLLDLSKAFDIIDHSILPHKRSRYGLRGKIEELLKSDLKDRKQFVRYKGESSSTKKLSAESLKDQYSGHFCFQYTKNDIVVKPKHSNILLYADDANIFGKYEKTELTSDVKLISSLLESNKLTPNIKKTILLLGPHNSSDKKLIWNGEEVEESKCVRYLGVKIDNKLTLKEHIDYVQMKCNQYISILYQTKKYLQRKLLLKIFKQYVQPQYQ